MEAGEKSVGVLEIKLDATEAKSLIEEFNGKLAEFQEATNKTVEKAVTEAVKSLQGELKQVSEAFAQLASTHTALESKYTALETSHKQLESDVLKIEVRPGDRQGTPRQAKGIEHLTDAVVLKSIGL